MTDIYLNGSFLPASEACVSVLDRGFLFGDGVYEVIPAYGGRLFRLREHLDRLGNSLAAVRIENPMTGDEWRSMLQRLLSGGGDGDQSVYLQVTRGAAQKRDHAFSTDLAPTVFAMVSPLATPDTELATVGITAITLEDIRWQKCDIKAVTLLPNVLMKQAAVDRGAGEAILVRNGHITEGSASNVFVASEGRIKTPPKSHEILPGITRDLVMELARHHGLECVETEIPINELKKVDEIWVTSSTREIVPVVELDDMAVGNGARGPLCKQLQSLYRDYVDTLRQGSDPLR